MAIQNGESVAIGTSLADVITPIVRASARALRGLCGDEVTRDANRASSASPLESARALGERCSAQDSTADLLKLAGPSADRCTSSCGAVLRGGHCTHSDLTLGGHAIRSNRPST